MSRYGYRLLACLAALALIFGDVAVQAAGKGGKKGGKGKNPPTPPVAAPVQNAGSDAASTAFQQNTLNDIRELARQDWSTLDSLGDNAVIVDPSKIALVTDYDVRAYFVGEDTSYRNSIGFNTQAGGIDSGNPQLIFSDATSKPEGYRVVDPDNPGNRSKRNPLYPGDFVDLGNVSAGTDLNFFLLVDGSTAPKDVLSSETALNPQQNPFMTAFAYTDGDSSYLVLGFEDRVGKGKKDFTDVVIALDIGDINLGALTASPEPATLLTLGSLIGLVGYARRRTQRAESDDLSD